MVWVIGNLICCWQRPLSVIKPFAAIELRSNSRTWACKKGYLKDLILASTMVCTVHHKLSLKTDTKNSIAGYWNLFSVLVSRIQEHHANIICNKNKIVAEPLTSNDVFINGSKITTRTALKHGVSSILLVHLGFNKCFCDYSSPGNPLEITKFNIMFGTSDQTLQTFSEAFIKS